MNKAVFLDRDGTINLEKNYLYKIEEFQYLPGVVDALRRLYQSGYLLIVITNQSGIARGYYTEYDFHRLNNWMVSDLAKAGVIISDVYYCPHLPDAKIETYRCLCNCRKPFIGLFEKAVKEHNIDLSLSFAVGDRMRDCTISATTACRGFLIGDSEDKEIQEKVKAGKVRNVKYATDMFEVANEILKTEEV